MGYKDQREQAEYYKRWRKRNPNYQKKWRAKNPGYISPFFAQQRLLKPAKRRWGKRISPTEAMKKWRLRNPLKVKAYRAVYVAVRNGSLKKKPCKKCGAIKAEAHHTDYSKPLKVVWLCKQHHVEADKIMRAKQAKSKGWLYPQVRRQRRCTLCNLCYYISRSLLVANNQ